MKRFFPITESIPSYPNAFIIQSDNDPTEELQQIPARFIPFAQDIARILPNALTGDMTIYEGHCFLIIGDHENLLLIQSALERSGWQRNNSN
jgi:hypothetical protein